MATELRRFVLRRGTADEWAAGNPILEAGEEGYETDTGFRKVGDGTSNWLSLDYDEGKAGPQGSPGPQGVPGPPGSLPATGIPARALYVEANGAYPTITLNSYKEFMGVGTPPADKTLTGDIWTKLAVAAPAGFVANSNGRGASSSTVYAYTLPAGAAGPAAGTTVILSVFSHTNTNGATWVATIPGAGGTTRTIDPIMAPYQASGFASAIYVFKADSATAGATFSIALNTPTAVPSAVQPNFMVSWFTGLKGAGTQGNGVDAARSTIGSAAVKTNPAKTTSVPNSVEFGIAQSHDGTAPVATKVNITAPLIEYNEQAVTTAPSPIQALGAILTPVAAGAAIGNRNFTFAQADDTTPSGPFGVAYTFAIEANAALAPTRLIWDGSAWSLLDGNV